MWGAIPDHCPEPASESESSDASLSPCAPLESPEDSMLDLPLDPPLKSILKKGMDGKKRGGESSDSGKESDEDNKMEEEEDGGGEEDYEGEDEREDDYEDFHDCEGFDDRGEYSWNCYLTTIEEEEEEEVEPETEELLVEEEEDSGNDSDLEKSELETFEMLEKLCEIESKEKGEKTVRGRIQSYHEYKRLKEAAPVVVEYKNQIVVEKDLKGLKIKPVDEGAKEEANGSLDGMPEISDEGDSMAEFGQMEEFTGEYAENRSGSRGAAKEQEIMSSTTLFPAHRGGKMAKFGQMEECAVEHVGNQGSLGEASEVPFSGSNIQFTAEHGGKMAKFVQMEEFSGEYEKSQSGFGGVSKEQEIMSSTTLFPAYRGGKMAKFGQMEECAVEHVDNQGCLGEASEKPFSGSNIQFTAQYGGKMAKFVQVVEFTGENEKSRIGFGGATEEEEEEEEAMLSPTTQFLGQHGGKKAKYGQQEECAGDYVDNQGRLDEACEKPFSGSESQFLAQHGGKKAKCGQTEECAVEHVENQGSLGDVPRIRVSGQNEPEFDDDDEDQESVLEIKVPSDFDSDDIPSPWMVHKSDLRAVTLPRSFFDNPQVTIDDDVYSEIPVDSNKGGLPPGRSIPVGLRDGGGNGINKDESRAPVTSRAPMKHDPDTKIKSALKRASSKKRKKHKVQFDESLNKFFEADYVILIREECGGGGCDCGGGDYCYADEEDDDDVAPVAALDLAPFEPPVEFVDQLTLSPPDGYKDHCLHHGPLPDDDKGTERWPPEEPKCEDGQTQTTPTSESEDNDGPLSLSDVPDKKERYIVETITMTTVTERRIIREAEEAQGASVHAPPPHVSKDKEMTLTFKLGSNSLKPNSALRQLFPRIASPPPDKSPDSDDDSLQSNLIKRTIERNTLRRSLVRYPDIRKRAQAKKNENSLVERIKKLTCDIDDDDTLTPPARSSPTGEESKENAVHESTSTTTVLETSKIPAYRKITDIFIRNKEPHPVVLQAPASVEHQYPYYQPYNPPDLGNGMPKARQTHEARKQFLSSLAPLTACVSSHIDDTPGSRDSTSTVDTDYSIGDIDDVLKEQKPQPDIVVGTPGNESDELALFVQQDASRIERLRKRYSSAAGSDDEQDDYGFNRRPSVRGIKPRFGSTTEILQQMQSQIAPPLPSGSHVSWPYYPPDDRNGRYVEEPHYSQNVIHVQQGQSVRLPYQAGPVQLHLMGGPQSRQVVVRGTQTISTYYQIPRPAPEQFPRGPLVYYPRSPVCGSPTKMKLERGVPEGASASPHQEQAALLPPPPGPPGTVPPGPPVPSQALPVTDPPLMYAMNV